MLSAIQNAEIIVYILLQRNSLAEKIKNKTEKSLHLRVQTAELVMELQNVER